MASKVDQFRETPETPQELPLLYTTGDQKPRVQLLATVSLVASCSQLLGIQSVTTKNLITGCAQSLKRAWSLVFKGVVCVEFKLLAGAVLIIGFGPGSCTGKVGANAFGQYGPL